MFMAVALYEGICHGEIGLEGNQQGEWLLVRILLRRNQAREVPIYTHTYIDVCHSNSADDPVTLGQLTIAV
jgi:hypothetical protein